MKILITNDDSVSASQLVPLIKWCARLGEVTTVVPKFEQSGKSHSIELHKSFEAKQVTLEQDIRVWTVDSTPADCVRFAVLGLKQQFDLVISGVNRGFNIGMDIMYSGTVGAACEAVNLGLQAIALSTSPGNYGHATEHLDAVFAYVEQHRLLERNDIFNINIPADPKGIRITRQGGPYYSDDFRRLDGDMYQPCGKSVWKDRGDDTLDTDATLHGYISITPLTLDKTDLRLFRELANHNA